MIYHDKNTLLNPFHSATRRQNEVVTFLYSNISKEAKRSVGDHELTTLCACTKGDY